MAQRRSLMEGLKPGTETDDVDPAVAEKFIYGDKPKSLPSRSQHSLPSHDIQEGKGQTGNQVSRTPLTIRFRMHIAAGLKRASLERQLKGVRPNTLQDILEEAAEPWLRSNGYLK
jgi:hypothetical protein